MDIHLSEVSESFVEIHTSLRKCTISNQTYVNDERRTFKNITDTPDNAFYKEGKANTALLPNWWEFRD